MTHHKLKSLAVFLLICLSANSCNRYTGPGLVLLGDLSVSYEVLDSVPHQPLADAVYVPSEDKIYIKSGRQSLVLVLHELSHKIRADLGYAPSAGSRAQALEEIVACKVAAQAGEIAGMSYPLSEGGVNTWIQSILVVNNLEHMIISEKEKEFIDKEVSRTVLLIIEQVKKSGHNLGPR